MAFLFFIPLLLGLICLYISKHFERSIERMDAEYTGDILPDKEGYDWYKYERRIKYRIMNAIRFIGYSFFYFLAVLVLTFLIELIF